MTWCTKVDLVKVNCSERALRIAYEDDDFLAVDKPSALHSVGGESSDTLASWIREFRVLPLGEDFEFGIMQRLDFETQGLVLVAKSPGAYAKLKDLLKGSLVVKTYYALVEGEFEDAAAVCGYIGAKSRSAKKVTITNEMPKHGRALYAETDFKFIKHLPGLNCSLVRAETVKGRRHQIRVSAASLGNPLIGDELYGSTQKLPEGVLASRFYLVAAGLSFVSPFSGLPVCIKTTIKPPELSGLREW